MNWNSILEFARGPFFYTALLIFIGGMLYRLVTVIGLGWKKDKIKSRGSKTGGVVMSFLKGIVTWPFIPWVKNTFKRNPLIYIGGGLFHLGLFVVVFLGTAHMLVFKSLLGFGWGTLSLPIVDWFAAAGIAGLIILLINRIIHPVLRLISGPAEYLTWLFVFLPMLTGYMLTHHMVSPYEKMFSLHMLSVDFLLIWKLERTTGSA